MFAQPLAGRSVASVAREITEHGDSGVLGRYALALGGRLHQAIYFDDGDITAIA